MNNIQILTEQEYSERVFLPADVELTAEGWGYYASYSYEDVAIWNDLGDYWWKLFEE